MDLTKKFVLKKINDVNKLWAKGDSQTAGGEHWELRFL
jgi:hypothetical protein